MRTFLPDVMLIGGFTKNTSTQGSWVPSIEIAFFLFPPPNLFVARIKPLAKSEIDIGRRLRDVREARKIPRTVLARRIGISSEGLRDYEVGRNPLPAKHGERICRILNVNQIWLLTGKSNRFGHIPFDKETQEQLAEHRLFSKAYGSVYQENHLHHYDNLSRAGQSFNLDPDNLDAESAEQRAWNDAIDSLRRVASEFPQEKRISFLRAMSVQIHRSARQFSGKYDDKHITEGRPAGGPDESMLP